MQVDLLEQAIHQAVEFLEKANADLDPELLTVAQARKVLSAYAKAGKLVAYGSAVLSHRVDDPAVVAKTTGTSMGKAKAVVATGKVMASSGELTSALQHGRISLDQAAVIASAEESAPGAAKDLLKVARSDTFNALKDEARRVKLEAEQHRELAGRQRAARSARTYTDELGMGHIHLVLEPHLYAPTAARAEAEAARVAKADKRAKKGTGEPPEPFERYLADAYAHMLAPGQGLGGAAGGVKGRAKRPEVVYLIDYRIVKRGWTHVEPGEVCKIPGVGPVDPRIVRAMAKDALVNAVLYDGKDLRESKRWSRSIPTEIGIALELGDPPDFDGIKCVDCGNRFKTEFDHVEPHVALGPCSTENLKPRCWSCHQAKTDRDRKAGKLRRPPDDHDPPEP